MAAILVGLALVGCGANYGGFHAVSMSANAQHRGKPGVQFHLLSGEVGRIEESGRGGSVSVRAFDLREVDVDLYPENYSGASRGKSLPRIAFLRTSARYHHWTQWQLTTPEFDPDPEQMLSRDVGIGVTADTLGYALYSRAGPSAFDGELVGLFDPRVEVFAFGYMGFKQILLNMSGGGVELQGGAGYGRYHELYGFLRLELLHGRKTR